MPEQRLCLYNKSVLQIPAYPYLRTASKHSSVSLLSVYAARPAILSEGQVPDKSGQLPHPPGCHHHNHTGNFPPVSGRMPQGLRTAQGNPGRYIQTDAPYPDKSIKSSRASIIVFITLYFLSVSFSIRFPHFINHCYFQKYLFPAYLTSYPIFLPGLP